MSAGTTVIIVACIASVVVGLTGNLIIVIVRIFKQLQRRNTTAYTFLISQLAIADFLFAFTIIFDIHNQMHDHWSFGSGMCKFIKTLQSTSISTTVGLLMLMAYERYLGLSRPLQHRWSIKRTSLFVFVIWVYIILTFIPFMIAVDVQDGYCYEVGHPSETFRKGYTMFLFITNFVIPLFCITVFHTLIVRAMRKHLNSMKNQRHRSIRKKIPEKNTSKSTPCNGIIDPDKNNNKTLSCWELFHKIHCLRKDEQSKEDVTSDQPSKTVGPPGIFRRLLSSRSAKHEDHKLVKMLAAVTLCFAVMTLPTQVYYIWYDFFRGETSSTNSHLLEVIASLIYMHCCVNCIIYSAMDKKFRRDVITTFKCLFKCKIHSNEWTERLSSQLSIFKRKSRSISKETACEIISLHDAEDVFTKDALITEDVKT